MTQPSTAAPAKRPLRLSRSIVGEAEARAVADVLLKDGYLGMGKEVESLEKEIADYLAVPASNVACVASGTVALQLAAEAALAPGSEVLIQSLTFISSFQALRAAGTIPVACEIDPESVTIDLRHAASRITARTRAVMPVHYASHPGDLDGIYAFAKSHGLRVIEDAAHAFGCRHGGRKIGSFGDVICFSFDGIKNFTCGEGGAVISSDQVVMQRVRDARLLGVERDTDRRYAGQRSWDFDVSRPGHRAHMNNIAAAIGRVQLRRLDQEFGPARVSLSERYRARLSKNPGVRLFVTGEGVIPHIMPVRILGGRRDALRDHLKRLGVETGIHYKPNHMLTLFRDTTPLPETERAYEEIVSLPLHPGLSPNDVDYICDATERFLSEHYSR